MGFYSINFQAVLKNKSRLRKPRHSFIHFDDYSFTCFWVNAYFFLQLLFSRNGSVTNVPALSHSCWCFLVACALPVVSSPHPLCDRHPHHHHRLQGRATELARAPAKALSAAGLGGLQHMRGEEEQKGTTPKFLRRLCLFYFPFEPPRHILNMFDMLRRTLIISLICERKPRT